MTPPYAIGAQVLCRHLVCGVRTILHYCRVMVVNILLMPNAIGNFLLEILFLIIVLLINMLNRF